MMFISVHHQHLRNHSVYERSNGMGSEQGARMGFRTYSSAPARRPAAPNQRRGSAVSQTVFVSMDTAHVSYPECCAAVSATVILLRSGRSSPVTMP
jgi:hypothetical protein